MRSAEEEAQALRARLRALLAPEELIAQGSLSSANGNNNGRGDADADAGLQLFLPTHSPRGGGGGGGGGGGWGHLSSPSSPLPTPSQSRYRSLIQQHKDNHELHSRLLQERQAAQDEDAEIQIVRPPFRPVAVR